MDFSDNRALALVGAAVITGYGVVPSAMADDDRIQTLERQIEELQRGLERLKQQQSSDSQAIQDIADESRILPQDEQVASSDEPLVTSGEPKVKLSVSGQVNRALNIADDGDSTKGYFVDNDVTNSRFRMLGTAELTEDLSFGAQIEIAASPNNSSEVSQEDEDTGDFFDQRIVEATLNSKKFGRVSLGKGHMASDETAEYTLSGMDVIMYSGVADIVGGLLFNANGDLTDVTVADAFFNHDGLGRLDRVRYDSPVFGPGLQLSASAATDQRYDAALTWGGDFGSWSGVGLGDFSALGAIAISDPNEDDVDWRLSGSLAFMHNPSGYNASLSIGRDEMNGSDDTENYYIYLGRLFSWNALGETGLGFDYTYSDSLPTPEDSGYSVGLAVVQHIESYGAELYGQIRKYDLDRDDEPSVDDVWVGTVGARVKF